VRPAGRASRGFTLIEVLVVLIIIVIISAVALLSLGFVGDERDLQTEVRRLSTLIELANDEASVLGRDYGLELAVSGYRFVEFDPLLNRWYEVIGDDILRPRKLEEGMEFDLFIEDRRILLEPKLATLPPPVADKDDEDDDQPADRDDDRDGLQNDYEPHVLIMSSGDVSPFELKIIRPADRAEMTLTMSLIGELEIQRDDNRIR